MSKSPDLLGNKGLDDVVREIRKPALPPETGFIQVGATIPEFGGDFAPSWTNGFGDPSGPNPKTEFYLSENGEVRFRGDMSAGLMGETAFELPEGYRPGVRQHFICALVDGHINMDEVRFRAVYTDPSAAP